MGLQAAILAVFLIGLFRLRSYMGLSLLYIALGVFQHIQTLLALSIYIEVYPGILVSPGSAVLFTGSFFAILLVYIREDAVEARKICYGILGANLIAGLLSYLFAINLKSPVTLNFYNLPLELFNLNARVMITGVLILALDVLLIIFVYEAVSRLLRKKFFLRVLLSLVVVLCVDTVLFVVGNFINQPNFTSILISGLIGKSIMAVFYSGILTLYLRVFEKEKTHIVQEELPVRDIFQLLTFRQKYQLLQEQMKIDPLTGVYNRGFFDDIVPKQVNLSHRLEMPVSLIMMDIDHFKRVNDSYGHQTGDVVLKKLAQFLSGCIRSSDYLYRYGGEEFAILLPNTPVASAYTLGKKIIEKLRDNPVAGNLLAVRDRITITMGIACYPDEVSSMEKLVGLADSRLYAGKEAGRNRIVWEGHGIDREETIGHA
jgi:diguanylate cyclase (GGDEF)-like protein